MGAFDSKFYKNILNSKEIGYHSDKPLNLDETTDTTEATLVQESITQETEVSSFKPSNPFEAFTYMFKAPDFSWKACIAILATFVYTAADKLPESIFEVIGLPVICIILVLLILGYPWFYGWALNSIEHIAYQETDFQFSEYNFKKDWIIFLKFNVAMILFVLAAVVCMLPLALMAVVPVIGAFAIMAGVLYIMYYFMAAASVFTITKKLTAFIQFKKINRLIKKSKGKYCKYFCIKLHFSRYY